jgi:hypothetical protein
VTRADLDALKRWFSDYTGSFYSSVAEDDRNYKLKIEHSHNVCANIVNIAKGEALSDNEVILAEAVGLLHDIGRFPQFREYRTFMDSRSVNHGVMGADTLVREGVLNFLPEDERELVIQAVRFHNAFSLPDLNDEGILYFLKMIRDADKIDIFRVFLDYYESSDDERASAAAHGLPDGPEYSRELLARLGTDKQITYADLRTLNDFKLMHLSWSYTLHFKSSYRLLKEKGYTDMIAGYLPQTDEILKAGESVREYIEARINS